jgi:hypothetical protein
MFVLVSCSPFLTHILLRNLPLIGWTLGRNGQHWHWRARRLGRQRIAGHPLRLQALSTPLLLPPAQPDRPSHSEKSEGKQSPIAADTADRRINPANNKHKAGNRFFAVSRLQKTRQKQIHCSHRIDKEGWVSRDHLQPRPATTKP